MNGDVDRLGIFRKIAAHQPIRMVAFGSSSTQRFLCGMHWFDYVELGFKNIHGHKVGQFINSGVSNDSTVELLARFDSECAIYRPDLVLLTVGANDCRLGHSFDLFRANLLALHDRVGAIGSDLVLQTFYPTDLERSRGVWLKVDEYHPTVRQVAEETGTLLVDTARRWGALRAYDLELYRTLLRDFAHLNERGNMLLGLDLVRFFGVGLLVKDGQIDYCREGLVLQQKVDALNRAGTKTACA